MNIFKYNIIYSYINIDFIYWSRARQQWPLAIVWVTVDKRLKGLEQVVWLVGNTCMCGKVFIF